MTSLIRMRLIAYVRTGRFILPLLSALILLGVLYGGGRSGAAEAYGVSALLLFPVLAWQTKLLLDAEPDVQRRLALAALGSRVREVAAGLVAAALAALPLVLLAIILPWLVGAVTSAGAGSGVALGVWAHVIIIPAAIAGHGVALGRSPLVKDLLLSKELVAPFKSTADPARAYFAVAAQDAAERPEVAAFIEWLKAEAAKR